MDTMFNVCDLRTYQHSVMSFDEVVQKYNLDEIFMFNIDILRSICVYDNGTKIALIKKAG